MDTVLSVVHAQVVFTVIVNKVSDGYTALTKDIVVTVLSVVHAQVVFKVIVNKVSDGYIALTKNIVVTVLSVVHVQVTRRSQTVKDTFKRTLAVLRLCRQTVNVVWAGGSGPFWPKLITSAVSLRGLNGM